MMPHPAPPLPAGRKRLHQILYVQVLVAAAAGGILGLVFPGIAAAMEPLGTGFVSLVRMIITPIVFLTLVLGVAGMQDGRKVGRVGGKAVLYFEVVSTLALVIGLVVGLLLKPGAGFDVNPATIDTSGIGAYVQQSHATTAVSFLLAIIPDTFFGAFTGSAILPVLLVALLSGFAIGQLGEQAAPLLNGLAYLEKGIFAVARLVMAAAPVGAFGAMAFVIGKYGLAAIGALLKLLGAVYLTELLFIVLVLGSIARLNGLSIFRVIAYIKDELLIVLGTSCAESALAPLMEKLRRAGAEPSVVRLVVPAGFSFNSDGTNIYMTLATLFIAQATNTHLDFSQLMVILLVALATSKGVGGVTGSGFIALAATLAVVPGIPIAGLALILGIDRFLSEARAMTNVVGNAVATLVIAKWEGALDMDVAERVLKARAPGVRAPFA